MTRVLVVLNLLLWGLAIAVWCAGCQDPEVPVGGYPHGHDLMITEDPGPAGGGG